MSESELVQKIARDTGVARKKVARIVRMTVDRIVDSISRQSKGGTTPDFSGLQVRIREPHIDRSSNVGKSEPVKDLSVVTIDSPNCGADMEGFDPRLQELLALQDELGILLTRRARSGEKVDYANVPNTPDEKAIWKKMIHPKFEETIERLVSVPGTNSESRRLWLKTLADCKRQSIAHRGAVNRSATSLKRTLKCP